jgi:hypothetical protein
MAAKSSERAEQQRQPFGRERRGVVMAPEEDLIMEEERERDSIVEVSENSGME